MERFELRPLREASTADLIALANDPRVQRHMPLAAGAFGPAECRAFLAAKECMWARHGYGPWAVFIGGRFAGWGGFQPENGEPDLALVLHPDFWGRGPALVREFLRRAFGPMGFSAVTALLPPSRTRIRGLVRLGFAPDGEVELGGRRFLRYRLAQTSFRG